MSTPMLRSASFPTAMEAARETAPAVLAVACALCGLLLQAKLVVVGEIYLGEILLLATAAVTFLLRGVGRQVVGWFPWAFAVAGFLMLLGYVIADLIAATMPAQYLRGWARTILFGLDFLSLILLVSQGQRLLGWFAAGLAIGILAEMLIAGAGLTVTNWKSGYGFAAGILVVLLAGHLPALLAGAILGAFGILSILLDFRSLGAIFLLAGGIILARSGEGATEQKRLLRMVLVVFGAAAALAAVAATLVQSESDYHKRRQESNIGRYVGLQVAWEAITDSPFVGYGSWAADKAYVQLLRREFDKASAGMDIGGTPGDSLLPHSQLLQAWVEGGILAAIFFVLLGIAMIAALRWLVLFHRRGPLTPLYTVLVIKGMWDLCFSPFLGQHRIHVASVLATLSILAWERASVRSAARAGRAASIPA
jgi:hypothetical protein